MFKWEDIVCVNGEESISLYVIWEYVLFLRILSYIKFHVASMQSQIRLAALDTWSRKKV